MPSPRPAMKVRKELPPQCQGQDRPQDRSRKIAPPVRMVETQSICLRFQSKESKLLSAYMNTLHAIIDPNIFCMFRAGNPRFCTTFAENSNIFLRISRLGKLSEMPQNCGASIFWALPLRPRAIVVLDVHRGAFAQQKLCRRDVAVFRGGVQRRLASGGFPRGPSAAVAEAAGNDERCGQLSSIPRSTDKRTMNVSGLNLQNCSKQKTFTNTLNLFNIYILQHHR